MLKSAKNKERKKKKGKSSRPTSDYQILESEALRKVSLIRLLLGIEPEGGKLHDVWTAVLPTEPWLFCGSTFDASAPLLVESEQHKQPLYGGGLGTLREL